MEQEQIRCILLGSIRRTLGIHLPVKRNVYNGSRRKVNQETTKYRIGPAPVDDENIETITSKFPGILDDTADDDISGDITSTAGAAGNQALLTYLHRLACQSTDISEGIDFAFLLSLLNAGGDLNFSDKHGQTILHAIARDWHPDVADFVLEHGAIIHKRDKYGRTPLHLASAVGHIDMIKYLVSKGANIHARTYGEHQTTIHYAAKNNAIDSLRTLIQLGANMNDRDYRERTPLFLATELGRIEAVRYLLDLGAPAGVFDNSGNSCVSIMVEKIPCLAYEAFSQFLTENRRQGIKKYFLNYFEFNPQLRKFDGMSKTALEMVIKNKQLDLIAHPVIQKLIQVKWDLFGKKYVVSYFLLNMVYTLTWTAMSIIMPVVSTSLNPISKNWWRFILPSVVFLIGIAFLVEQMRIIKTTQRKDVEWRDWRIRYIQMDYKYCHPTWPDERRFIDLEVEHLRNMHSEYFRDPWNYIDWLCLLVALLSLASRTLLVIFPGPESHEAVKICLSLTILLTWVRMMKICRGFQITGLFISFLGSILKAVMQFSFLFVDIFIPICVAFWVMFGGKENAAKMRHKGQDADYEYLYQTVYRVFALSVDAQHSPMSLKSVHTIMSHLFISVVFVIVTFISLRVFIALLLQVMSHVYIRGKEYASMEQAKVILLAEKIMNAREKQNDFIRRRCSPLIEENLEKDEAYSVSKRLEMSLGLLKRQVSNIVDLYKEHKKLSGDTERSTILKNIREDIDKVEYRLRDWKVTLAALKKTELGNKKLLRLFEKLGTKDKGQKRGRDSSKNTRSRKDLK